MDSMRSLNTSLPTSSPKGRRDPPEQLLQAFRSAALSVTTLYKTAASDQAHAHQAGYQEALDDLLAFLDHENLGLGDGEGWRVRQWATERLDGTGATGESDDEKVDVDTRARSSSPAVTRKEMAPEQDSIRLATRSASPARTTVPIPSSTHAPPATNPSSESFTFRSTVTYPTPSQRERDQDMHGTDSDPSSASSTPQQQHQPRAAQLPPPPTERHTPGTSHSARGPRHRHIGGALTRPTTRSAVAIGTLAHGAGTKRRIPFGDFFDIGSTGNGKDGFGGGGKRGRFS